MKKNLYIINDKKIESIDIIYIIILSIILGGIFGFIYETIFYRIDLGYFVKRGSSFGPWIPIYVIGSLLIITLTYKYKSKPLLVFILNTIITGLLEYITGFILYNFYNTRLWDYNTEILNFGNINGYICLRSVLFFGLSSLFLIYVLLPFLIKIYKRYTVFFKLITVILAVLYLLDIIIYNIVK